MIKEFIFCLKKKHPKIVLQKLSEKINSNAILALYLSSIKGLIKIIGLLEALPLFVSAGLFYSIRLSLTKQVSTTVLISAEITHL